MLQQSCRLLRSYCITPKIYRCRALNVVANIQSQLTTHLSTPRGWKAELAWLVDLSPISYRSSAGRRKNAGQRLTFYRWATQTSQSQIHDSQINLPGFRKLTYEKRLQRLHVPSLKLRLLIWRGVIKVLCGRKSFTFPLVFITKKVCLLNLAFRLL